MSVRWIFTEKIRNGNDITDARLIGFDLSKTQPKDKVYISKNAVVGEKSDNGTPDVLRVELEEKLWVNHSSWSAEDENTSNWLKRRMIQYLPLFNTFLQSLKSEGTLE